MFDRAEFVDTCPQRANFIEWLPFEKGQSVLTHRGTASAVCQMLQKKGVDLVVLEEGQMEKLSQGLCKEQETGLCDGRHAAGFDWILLAGLPVDAKLLRGLYGRLKPAGRLVVLLHNRYGMSYLAGKPAYDDAYYAEIEADSGTKTAFTSFYGLEKLLAEAGIDGYQRFYPDMDSMFAANIYSDVYLPKVGDCNIKSLSFSHDRLAVFQENEALDEAVKQSMYPIFANDYLIVTGEKLPQVMVRYSNDRAEQYQIKTEIWETTEGRKVCKMPLKQAGLAHVQKMCRTYELLCGQYDKDVFTIVPCSWEKDRISFPFVTGTSLAEHIKTALQEGDKERVFAWFEAFLKKLCCARNIPFSNYDFIFSNIIIDGDNWQVIDYEWTADVFVAPEELAFRAAYCFYLEHKDFPFEEICHMLGFGEQQRQGLIDRETAYQHSITGSQESLGSLCEQYGGRVYTREQLLRAVKLSVGDSCVQVYEDSGNGFCEADSYFVEQALVQADRIELTLQTAHGVKALRIDPCDEPCIIQIKRLCHNGEELFCDKVLRINGVKGKKGRDRYAEYVFATEDPNITIPLEQLVTESGKVKQSFEEWQLELEIHKISMQLAKALSKSIKRII